MADNGAARGAGRGDGSSSDGAVGLDLLANAAAASVRAAGRGAVSGVGEKRPRDNTTNVSALPGGGRGGVSVVGEKRPRDNTTNVSALPGAGRGGVSAPPASAGRGNVSVPPAGAPGTYARAIGPPAGDCNCMAGCTKCKSKSELLESRRKSIQLYGFHPCTKCNQDPELWSVDYTVKFLGSSRQVSTEIVRQAVEGTLTDANDNAQKQPVVIAGCGCPGRVCYTASLWVGTTRTASGKSFGDQKEASRHIFDRIKKYLQIKEKILASRAAMDAVKDAPSPAAAPQLAGAPGPAPSAVAAVAAPSAAAAVAAGAPGGGVQQGSLQPEPPGQLPAGQQPPPPSAPAPQLAGAPGPAPSAVAAVAAGAPGGGVQQGSLQPAPPGQLPAGQQPPPPSGPAPCDAYLQILQFSLQLHFNASKWPICAVMLFFLWKQEKKEWSAYHEQNQSGEEFKLLTNIVEAIQKVDPGPFDGNRCLELTRRVLQKTLDALPSYIVSYQNGGRNMQGLFRYFVAKYLAPSEHEKEQWNTELLQAHAGSAEGLNFFLTMMGVHFTAFKEFHTAGSSGVGGAAQVP